jgi:hypothetical protein
MTQVKTSVLLIVVILYKAIYPDPGWSRESLNMINRLNSLLTIFTVQ